MLLFGPGIYIEELPAGDRTIVGVSTSITAFVGVADRGDPNVPTHVRSYAEFEGAFGTFSTANTLAYAVSDYFANGGSHAVIVRLNRKEGRLPKSK